MHINTRKSWGARRPRPVSPPGSNRQSDAIIREFFIHHPADPHGLAHIDTDMEQDAYARAIQDFHMDDPAHKWNDIGYSFLVFQDGRVYRGRGRHTIPAAQLKHNTGTIAVLCVLGDGETPSRAMVRSLGELKDKMDSLVGRDLIARPHSAVTATSCPGDPLRSIIPGLNKRH